MEPRIPLAWPGKVRGQIVFVMRTDKLVLECVVPVGDFRQGLYRTPDSRQLFRIEPVFRQDAIEQSIEALKLVVFPVLALVFVSLFGIEGANAAAAVIFAAIPASASSFVLAGQLGGDRELMAAIITSQTLAACVTLPLVLGLL